MNSQPNPSPKLAQKPTQRLPKRLLKEGRGYLPKKHRRGIKLDSVKASDLRIYDPRFFCDDCSHFDSRARQCTIGYRAQHTRAEQMVLYVLSGKMALCRMIEID